MIEKKVFFTLITSVTISGFIVICTLGQSLHQQKIEAKCNNAVQELEKVECIVREYNGKLGIFRGDSKTPYKTIDCNFSLLSEYDKELLLDGVVMKSEEELKTFLEDMVT